MSFLDFVKPNKLTKKEKVAQDKLLDSDEDFEYDSDEYMEFVFAEEKFYDFVYYTLDKRYGVKNCLPY